MNTTARKTLLALAIATLFGATTAYAGDHDNHHHRGDPGSSGVQFDKKVKLETDIDVSGDPRVRGHIDIDSAAIAIVDNAQSNGGNSGTNENLSNSASAADNVAQGAQGNIGVNIGAGDNNQQDNAAALSATDASFAFGMADAEVFVNQQGAYNDTMNVGVTNAAGLGGNAFQGAAGNLGVNVTSGNNNQQKNAMAASVATTRFAQATVSSDQASAHNTVSNAGFVEQYNDTVHVSLSGDVSGYSLGYGVGGYEGSSHGGYIGTSSLSPSDSDGHGYGPDTLSGGPGNNPNHSHPGDSLEGTEQGYTYSHEHGKLGFVELSADDLYANLCGSVVTTRWVINDATNTASLSGNAFQYASGNIGINVSAGTGNQQANSLAMAVAQPSAATNGGGGD